MHGNAHQRLDRGDAPLIILDIPDLTEIFRRFRAWILRRDVQVVGQCKLCGDCCKDIVLYNEGRWISTEKQFRKLCEFDPRHERLVCKGKADDGVFLFSCSSLGEDGMCTCHDDRMALCRNYPDNGIYYRGGWLRKECGYSFKVTTFRDVFMHRKRLRMPDFHSILEQEKDKT